MIPEPQPDCIEILTEVNTILKLLEQGMQTQDLHARVDLFYYIERKTKMKLLCRELQCPNPDIDKFNELKTVYSQFQIKWQNDYKFLVTPKSLHVYLVEPN